MCDGEDNAPFELRISIQKIQTFFKESELLKINRSTLINPAKVQSIQKIAKQKYAVLMGNGENLSISRSLEKHVRNYFQSN
jgi:DNA-binding LytR/AlgR family response regulator